MSRKPLAGPDELPPCGRAALQYIQRGWRVVNCSVTGKRGPDGAPDPNDGKAPLWAGWQKSALAAEDIPARFGRGDNVGLLLGEASGGLVDVDCDCRSAQLAASLLLPPTPMRHGRASVGVSHFWYQCPDPPRGTVQFEDPEPPPAPDGSKLKGTLIELRSTGGQTVVPPSRHMASGDQVAWAEPVSLTPTEIRSADLKRAVARSAAASLMARRWQDCGVSRNKQAMLLGGLLAKAGLPRDDAEQLLEALCLAAEDTETSNRLSALRASYSKLEAEGPAAVAGAQELAEAWGVKTLAQICKWLGLRSPGQQAPLPGIGGAGAAVKGRAGVNAYRQELGVELKHHDEGNAERFLKQHADKLVYCGPLGGWHIWDGARLRRDETGRAFLLAAQTAKSIEAEAGHFPDDLDKQALTRYWALHTQNKQPCLAMLDFAAVSPHVVCTPEQLDALPWRASCPNAALDLSFEGLREILTNSQPPPAPQRSLLLTKLLGASFDREAQCPRWLAFLDEIFAGDEELIRFMQRLAGYWLFGGNPEQVLLIFHGSGANGKSKFLEAISHVLGEYAASTSSDVLIARDNPGNNQYYALAQLKGKRLVVASETEDGHKLNEGLVKAMTGGELITARFSRENFFTYTPEFTPVLMTNHRPAVHGLDYGIWRRILLVPFTVTIPEERQDGQLGEKLAKEAPGILLWMLQGLWSWHVMRAKRGGRGLAPPGPVLAATDDYRSEQDLTKDFREAWLAPSPGYQLPRADMLAAYESYCAENGLRAVHPRTLYKLLRAAGLSEGKSGGVRFFTDQRLLHDYERQRREAEADP